MKVQFISVGGQLGPVLSGLQIDNPDYVYLLHSKETKDDALKIAKKNSIKSELIEIDFFDFNKIEPALNKLFEKHINDLITCNITAGTKPVAILLYSIALKYGNSKVIYLDQNDKCFELKSKSEVISTKNEISILNYLDFLGNKPKSLNKIEEFNDEDFRSVDELRKLFIKYHIEFLELSNLAERDNPSLSWKTKRGSELNFIKNENLYSFNFFKNSRIYNFQSKNANILVKKNGWFELDIARILSKWKRVDELILNVIFKYKTGNDKNEIDIILRHKNKLLFIEAKLQVNDIKDIEKFNSAVSNFGGLGAKKILITENKIKPNVKEKCDDYHILTFNINDDYTLFGGVENALFSLLESELFVNNKK